MNSFHTTVELERTAAFSELLEHLGLNIPVLGPRPRYLLVEGAGGGALAVASTPPAQAAYARWHKEVLLLGGSSPTARQSLPRLVPELLLKAGVTYDVVISRSLAKAVPRRYWLAAGWRETATKPGEEVYEWVNPAYTFYTYKITASDSEKYYYGVSHVCKGDASEDDCLKDGYWGTGGAKLNHWKAKRTVPLTKTILGRFASRREAYAHERELVGDAHKYDSLCLNSHPGGIIFGDDADALRVVIAVCSTHGETKHRGGRCLRCLFKNSITLATCSLHGETKHQGGLCLKCKIAAYSSLKECPTHGLTAHRGDTCMVCSATEAVLEKHCEIHGLTKHRGDHCLKCLMARTRRELSCPGHGLTTHIGNTCMKCSRATTLQQLECPTHGLTLHEGTSCVRCKGERVVSEQQCPKHGLTLFRGSSCAKCAVESGWSEATCAVHGLTKFFGSSCWQCKNEKQVTEQECPVHGKAHFIGGTCYKCTNQKAITVATCLTHGETKHQGGRCCKCAQAKRFSVKLCPRHGETKHNGNSCYKCIQERRKVKPAQ